MGETLAVTSEEEPVAVWRIPLDRDVEVDEDWLSEEEKSFATGFRDVLLRGRFLATRRGVRRVLGAETGMRPRELRFENGKHGKPLLAGPGTGLEFNLTHTENVALLAVSRTGPVGIDIESAKRDTDFDHLAPRVMTKPEHERFCRLSLGARQRAFFHLWTSKEAVMKVTGFGLGIDPRKIETDPHLAVEDLVRFRIDDVRVAGGEWMARRLEPGAPYIAFLAQAAGTPGKIPPILDLPALDS